MTILSDETLNPNAKKYRGKIIADCSNGNAGCIVTVIESSFQGTPMFELLFNLPTNDFWGDEENRKGMFIEISNIEIIEELPRSFKG